MNTIILLLFVATLVTFVATGLPILAALVAGYFLFAVYCLVKGYSVKSILKMSVQGIKTTKNILITFMLIGILTALWRAGGTIPFIICSSADFMSPEIFVLLTFVLNCIVSFITGTAFGTAATMGVICMTMAQALGISQVIMGGAILSGAYFGDRCSPVSTSALLVAELTKTDIYENLKNMLKTGVIPFVLACGLYGAYGIFAPISSADLPDICGLFSSEFNIGLVTILPAISILVTSFFKLNVKASMLISIAASIPICLFYQNITVSELLNYSLFGFTVEDEAVAEMISGGGIISMVKVTAIVCIASSYSGIFKETGLLEPISKLIEKMGRIFSPYTVILIASVISAMVACNQTLSIMLTEQLCNKLETDPKKLALYLENSAVVVAALVPWAIACGVVFAFVEAPTISILAAAFLYLLPVYSLIIFRRKK